MHSGTPPGGGGGTASKQLNSKIYSRHPGEMQTSGH